MKKEIKNILFSLVESVFIAGFVVILALPFSCTLTEAGIQIIGGDYTAPVLEKLTVVDNKTLQFDFSEPVKLSSLIVSPFIPGISDSSKVSYVETLAPSLAAAAGEYGRIEASVQSTEAGKSFTVLMAQETVIGKAYEVYGVVEDEIGNSLTFCLPFTGYNSQLPRIIITELQIKYGKGSSNGQTLYRAEYAEFLALEDGNLAGLVLESAADGHGKDYEFPAIDVKKGEVFLVHFRTVGEGCINEIEEDLDLATAPHSANSVRDLWSENTTARFNDSSDVIILRDTVNDIVMDALMYAALDAEEWKSTVAEAAIEAAESGIYSASEISSASSSKGLTTLKSLTRIDSEEILELVSSGPDYDFPFMVDESTWTISSCSPGRL